MTVGTAWFVFHLDGLDGKARYGAVVVSLGVSVYFETLLRSGLRRDTALDSLKSRVDVLSEKLEGVQGQADITHAAAAQATGLWEVLATGSSLKQTVALESVIGLHRDLKDIARGEMVVRGTERLNTTLEAAFASDKGAIQATSSSSIDWWSSEEGGAYMQLNRQAAKNGRDIARRFIVWGCDTTETIEEIRKLARRQEACGIDVEIRRAPAGEDRASWQDVGVVGDTVCFKEKLDDSGRSIEVFHSSLRGFVGKANAIRDTLERCSGWELIEFGESEGPAHDLGDVSEDEVHL